jgi:hypothetical protein
VEQALRKTGFRPKNQLSYLLAPSWTNHRPWSIRPELDNCVLSAALKRISKLARERRGGSKRFAVPLPDPSHGTSLPKRAAPELFQRIRDEIDRLRDDGETIVFFTDFGRSIRDSHTSQAIPEEAKMIVQELAKRHMITGDATTVEQRLARIGESVVEVSDKDKLSRSNRPKLLTGVRKYIGDEYRRIRAARLKKIEKKHKPGRERDHLEGQLSRDLQRECEVITEAVLKEIPDVFDEPSVAAVTEQMAAQGSIADVHLASGERVLVLRIGEIEKYAGSLVVAARNNTYGVPAIEIGTVVIAAPAPARNEARGTPPACPGTRGSRMRGTVAN